MSRLNFGFSRQEATGLGPIERNCRLRCHPCGETLQGAYDMNVHFGCGQCVGTSWENYDASPTLWLQRLPLVGAVFKQTLKPRFPDLVKYGDVVAGLPLADNSCDAIFSSHTLEHLALDDCRVALRNCHRYLKPGGLFRLVVPDFEVSVASYLSNSQPEAASNFMGYTHLGRKSRPRGLASLMREHFGNSHHLWMWDYKGLAKELEDAGYRNIRRCVQGDSKHPEFLEVDLPDRYEWSLGIEATK